MQYKSGNLVQWNSPRIGRALLQDSLLDLGPFKDIVVCGVEDDFVTSVES